MPHIIVEYPDRLESIEQISTLLDTIHEAVAQSGLFEASHIKTRAYPFRCYTHAGGDTPYIHIQARIKSGRPPEQKKQLSEAILSVVGEHGLPFPVTTVEIVDMDRDSYAKHTRD